MCTRVLPATEICPAGLRSADPSSTSIPKFSITAPFHWKKLTRKSVIHRDRRRRGARRTCPWSDTEFVCWTSLPMLDTCGQHSCSTRKSLWLVAPGSWLVARGTFVSNAIQTLKWPLEEVWTRNDSGLCLDTAPQTLSAQPRICNGRRYSNALNPAKGLL